MTAASSETFSESEKALAAVAKQRRIRESQLWRITLWSLTCAAIASAAAVGALVVAVALWFYQPPPRVLALTHDNRLIELHPLDNPVYSRLDIVGWVEKALRESHTMSFVDYRWRTDQACNRYFTVDGCSGFRAAIRRNVEAVKARRVAVAITLDRPPIIAAMGVHRGRYTWDVEAVATLTYESAVQTVSQQATISVRVVRVSNLMDTDGLGIVKYIMI